MKLARLFGIIATIVVVTGALTSSGKAYSTYGTWGTLDVSFYVNPANGDVSQNAATSALQAGMSAWNDQAGTAFRFNYAGQVSTTSTGYDNKNVVVFRNQSNGSTIASTYSWSSNGLLVDSDIVFWDGGRTFFTGSSGCTSGGAYIEDIAAHEFGHALGLHHSSEGDATMYPTYSSCSQEMRTLSPDDIAGAQSLYGEGAGEEDTPPTVTILAPGNGASVSSTSTVTFSGSATDTTDGDISSDLVWSSSISGQIGTGASFSRTLPAGTHTISATVTDSMGYTITKANSLTVTSGSTNTAPTVTIASPSNGASVTAGMSMSFSGSASDVEQGSLTSQLVWNSSLDGQIGTGGSFIRTLTAGTHTITAIVTDSGGLVSQKAISVTVTASSTPPAPSDEPKLTAHGYKKKGVHAADLSWSGLSAASVDVYRNNTKVATKPNTGAMTDDIGERGKGSYTYKVCAAGTSTCSNEESVSF